MVLWPHSCQVALILLACWGQPNAVLGQTLLDPENVKPGAIPTLLVLNSDGSALRKLTGATEFDGQGSPMWSADSQEIVFDAWRASKDDNFSTSQIFVVRSDGKELRRLIDGALPSFSPDQSYISFSRYHPNFGAWSMGRDGSDRTQINDRGWCATWSPDGRSIAYIMSGTNLAVYDVTTGEERVLLQNEHADRFQDIRWGFCWSPDSKQLCFHGTSKTPSELVIVDVRGSSHGLQVFALSEFGNKVAWHPDGQQILYSALDKTRNTEQLHILDRRHPEQSRVVPGQPSKTRNNGPAWSPDGKQIVFCAYVTPFWSPR